MTSEKPDHKETAASEFIAHLNERLLELLEVTAEHEDADPSQSRDYKGKWPKALSAYYRTIKLMKYALRHGCSVEIHWKKHRGTAHMYARYQDNFSKVGGETFLPVTAGFHEAVYIDSVIPTEECHTTEDLPSGITLLFSQEMGMYIWTKNSHGDASCTLQCGIGDIREIRVSEGVSPD